MQQPQRQRPPIAPPPPPSKGAGLPPAVHQTPTEELSQVNPPSQQGSTTTVRQSASSEVSHNTVPTTIPVPPQKQKKVSTNQGNQTVNQTVVLPQAPPPLQSNSRVLGRSPDQPTLASMVRKAFETGYSDLHLGVGEVPRMRDRGDIVMTNYPETDKNTFMSWLREVLAEDQIQKFKNQLEFDGATQYDFARVRINIFESLLGPAMVLRIIPLTILTIEQLGLPAVFKDVSDVHQGIVLVTGPTGSGKSTTLAAMVDYINKNHSKHILSIEDPVEFVHQSRKSIIRQREVGIHTLEYDNALKSALREDPDVILIGEMRDRSTVNTALKAAQTGHLVMGTLHTSSAVKTIDRILTLYSAEEQDAMRIAIAESLVGVISQGLCRTTDGKRTAYHDILINTEAVKDYIEKGKYDEILQLMQNGEYYGMITTNQSLFNLYQDDRITQETALEMSPAPNEMAMMLRGKI